MQFMSWGTRVQSTGMRRGGCCYLLLGYVSNIRTTFLLHCFLISSHFFINLTCCDRDLQLDSPGSRFLVCAHPTFQFKFLISKSTGCFGHRWIDPQIPNP